MLSGSDLLIPHQCECAGCAEGTLELPVTPEGVCSSTQNPSGNTECGVF